MNAQDFLDNFAAIAEAPDGVQKLRKLILDLAVRGQLVPQSTSEEAANVLLRTIPELRAGLITTGVISKPRHPAGEPIGQPPYEIPLSWEWVHLGDIGAIVGGGTPKSKEPSYWAEGDGIPWLTPADMRSQTSTIVFRGARDITEAGLNTSGSSRWGVGRCELIRLG